MLKISAIQAFRRFRHFLPLCLILFYKTIQSDLLEATNVRCTLKNILIVSNFILLSIIGNPLNKCVAFKGFQAVLVAPVKIHFIKLTACDLSFRLKSNSILVLKELNDITAVFQHFVKIALGLFGNSESEISPDKSAETVKHPAENQFLFSEKFISNKRIVAPVLRLRLGGKYNQSSCKSDRMIVKCFRCPIAEREYSGVKIFLLRLLPLSFNVNGNLRCNQRFYNACGV